jgi:hypothetical protein
MTIGAEPSGGSTTAVGGGATGGAGPYWLNIPQPAGASNSNVPTIISRRGMKTVCVIEIKNGFGRMACY